MLGRQDCYKLLIDIKNKGINVDKYFLMLSQSVEIPVEVIKFINENRELDITRFYEDLREKHNKRKSKMYYDLMRELEPEESIITLSSLITRAFIFGKTLSTRDRIQFYENIDIPSITSAINEYTKTSDIGKCLEILSKIKNDIKVLESYKEI